MAPVDHCFFPVVHKSSHVNGENIQFVSAPLECSGLVDSLCSRESLSDSTIFKVAWALVLRCFVGGDSVCFGCVSDGSEATASADAPGQATGATASVGFCSIDFPGTDGTLDLLRRVQSETQNGNHMDGVLKTSRFNTVLQFLDNTAGNLPAPSLVMCDAAIDMHLSVSTSGVHVSYREGRITETQAANVAFTLVAAISRVLANPLQLATELDILSDRDRWQIQLWNDANLEGLCVNTCIHDLIKQHADSHPHWLAVDAWDGRMTFQELWKLSSQLAFHLASLGVGPGTTVPLLFETCHSGIISMLSVLRAGGVCVTLDSSDPVSRLEAIIRETQSTLAICSPSLVERLKGRVREVIVTSPELFAQIASAPSDFSTTIQPTDAAFIMFTSGSTGVPKGIIQTHAGICTSVTHLAERLQISCQSRVYQHAPYVFDVSIADAFGTMARGGCVCYASDHDRDSDLAGAITSLRATHVCLTPTLLAQINPTNVPSLRYISVGGEAISKEDVITWADSVHLNNIYGTTEATIWCMINKDLRKDSNPSNIGRPFGCVAWIVDPSDHSRLVPIGAIGELLFEGPMLARGYLNEKATAMSFIHDPPWLPNFRNNGKGRLYKTGDLVQYEPDGTIKFVGRKDTQVKLYNYRVELGDIEYHIRQCLSGTAAHVVVCAVDSHRGEAEPDLAAFICMPDQDSDDAEVDAGRIRDKLSELLPEYMVPSAYNFIREFPRTASGKTDRKKLGKLAAELRIS